MNNAILFIMPSTPMINSIKAVMAEYDNTFPVHKTHLDEAVELARRYIQDGTKVIVSYGVTATLLREHTDAYIIEIQYNGFDLYRTVNHVLKQHKKVAIIGFETFIYRARQVVDTFDLPIRIKQIASVDEIVPTLRQLGSEGITAFIGGSVVEHAISLGYTGVYIDIDNRAVRDAIDESLRMLRIQQDKEARLGTTLAILNSMSEGLVAVDKTGKISEINHIAEKMLNRKKETLLDKPISLIMPESSMVDDTLKNDSAWFGEVLSVNSELYAVNCVPVLASGENLGAVLSLQEPQRIQTTGQKISKAYRSEGHTAANTFRDIVGDSAIMQKTKERAKTFAAADSTVLIDGETGTGKELFAQSIHNASHRRDAPFVAINCAALPESLLESELFGYVKGAFSGASSTGKMGLFEIANTGTIFLDEIGEMALPLQSRLLRVLQEKEIWRIGDIKRTPVDIRVIAATHRDLAELVQEGKFREDLYYRLSVLIVQLPPLRQRMEDLEPLANQILLQKGKMLGRSFNRLSRSEVALLAELDWPGNIRQLSNVIERAAVMSTDDHIGIETLRESLQACSRLLIRPRKTHLEMPLENHEIFYGKHDDTAILQALVASGGVKKEAAKKLGISVTTLWRRLRLMEQKKKTSSPQE